MRIGLDSRNARTAKRRARGARYHYNPQGSVDHLTDSTGTIAITHRYDTWGNVTSALTTAAYTTALTGNPYLHQAANAVITDTASALELSDPVYSPSIGRELAVGSPYSRSAVEAVTGRATQATYSSGGGEPEVPAFAPQPLVEFVQPTTESKDYHGSLDWVGQHENSRSIIGYFTFNDGYGPSCGAEYCADYRRELTWLQDYETQLSPVVLARGEGSSPDFLVAGCLNTEDATISISFRWEQFWYSPFIHRTAELYGTTAVFNCRPEVDVDDARAEF